MKKAYLPILVFTMLMIFQSPMDSFASNFDDASTGIIFDYSNNEIKKEEPKVKSYFHYSYVAGYPTGEFRPDDEITRAEVASIFEGLLVGQTFYDKPVIDFFDVNEEDWFYRSVTFMTKQGYMSGYPEGYFEPNMPITRAELVTVLTRYQNITEGKGGSIQFSDIEEDHWAFKDLQLATELGWLKGYADKSFRPNSSISRAEAITLINRVLNRNADEEFIKLKPKNLKEFYDTKNHWAYLDICEAANTHEFYYESTGEEVWTRILNF